MYVWQCTRYIYLLTTRSKWIECFFFFFWTFDKITQFKLLFYAAKIILYQRNNKKQQPTDQAQFCVQKQKYKIDMIAHLDMAVIPNIDILVIVKYKF